MIERQTDRQTDRRFEWFETILTMHLCTNYSKCSAFVVCLFVFLVGEGGWRGAG